MKKEDVFKDFYSQTKEEIIEEFKGYYDFYKKDDFFEEDSKEQKEKYLNLCKRFIQKLEQSNLPKITDDWWCYSFVIRNNCINLCLSLCTELKLDEEDMVSEATFTDEYTLFSVKCDYLSVSEYAKLHNVTEVTVRQWIRRGKLRSAKKEGRDWLIPDIANKPGRGFRNVLYYFSQMDSKLINKYPFLDGYKSVYIFQNQYDKSVYDVILKKGEIELGVKVQMSNSEREKFELDLISSGLAEVEEY